ncbi:MAG: LytTR family DNA-binding domain-containing protein [Aquificaceae bacterium]|nr:LytTR family DNA-binding domain-containing protein [Aquificaceae bacterium]MDW8423366.1 LytTR family DNA-binding domain-containing protein [Aquificaceae bacterium]
MRAFIVEDEPLAVQRLKRMINQDGRLEVVGEASTYEEAIRGIEELRPDVVFLDIRLPDGNGIDVAKEILSMGLKPYVIFTTAYGEYALEAFRVSAVDYLLKPFSQEDLKRAIDKIFEKRNNLAQVMNFIRSERPIIPVKIGNKVMFLSPEDIYYVQAEMGEVSVRTKEGLLPLSKKLYEIEEELKPYYFFRVHRSYLVNLKKVKELKSVEQSKYVIIFKEINETLKTSREGAKALREYLNL